MNQADEAMSKRAKDQEESQRYANNLGDGGKNETVASKEFEEKAAAKGVQRPTKTTESAKKSAKKAKRKHEEVAGSESDEEDEKKPAAPKEVAAKKKGWKLTSD
eukprot:g62.t1 g62   contig1:140177-140590(-)